MQDYAPRQLSDDDIATGNLFEAVVPSDVPTVGDPDGDVTERYTEPVPVESYAEQYAHLIDHYRLLGIPAGLLPRLATQALAKRKATTRYAVKVYAPVEAQHETFTASYTHGRSWRPNHDRRRADNQDAPMRIVQTRLG